MGWLHGFNDRCSCTRPCSLSKAPSPWDLMLFSHCLEIILSAYLCFVSEIPRHGETCTPSLVSPPSGDRFSATCSPTPRCPGPTQQTHFCFFQLSPSTICPRRDLPCEVGERWDEKARALAQARGEVSALSRGKPFLHSQSRDQAPELNVKVPGVCLSAKG